MDQKGQGLSTSAIILIVLGVVVLAILILGFTIGWGKINPWLANENNIDEVVQQCNVACLKQSVYDYCNSVNEINGLDKTLINKLKEPFLESFNLDEELDSESGTAKLSCDTFSNSGYFSCDIDCSYSVKQQLDAISDWDVPTRNLEGEELIKDIDNFEERSITSIGSVSSYSGNFSDYKKEFFSKLKTRLNSASANNPMIILIGDVHGTPEVQYEILEELRENFNLNFVGLEGWAGETADNKRGYMLLNAEEDLIKKLYNSPSYEIIPLEDAKIQEIALKSHLIESSRYPKEILTDLIKEMGEERAYKFIEGSLVIAKPPEEDYIRFSEWEMLNKERMRFIEYNKAVKWWALKLHVKSNNLYSNKKGEGLNEIISELNDYFGEEVVNKCIFLGNCFSPINEIDCNKNYITPDYITVTKRSCIMAEKMDEAMKEEDKPAGIIVAGYFHSSQIIKLLRQKDYNVIYIEPEKLT